MLKMCSFFFSIKKSYFYLTNQNNCVILILLKRQENIYVNYDKELRYMEDVMETCWIDSVTMCARGYKCESCPKNKEYQEIKTEN